MVSFKRSQRAFFSLSLCNITASPALYRVISERRCSFGQKGNGNQYLHGSKEKTYSGLATVRIRELGATPAFASRLARRFRRSSLASYPACLALPLSSKASTIVSERVLYAVVFLIGSVEVAIVEDTADEAREI